MNPYIIFTDSSCDIPADVLKEWEVPYVNLTFVFEGEGIEYKNDATDFPEFYRKLRGGTMAKTSAVNAEVFEETFEGYLQQGLDILYIAFSSGLSATYQAACAAASELQQKYPERKLRVVDSRSASAGMGLLLYLTVLKKKEGASLDEAADYAENAKFHLCHWFTVDDLNHLKRGGRISPTVAFFGSLIGIKPILHMDDPGHLINMSKARGRKASIQALADKYGELAIDKKKGPVFISHGDCYEDAVTLKEILKKEYGVKTDRIVYVGPVIGAHSGPGTLALFFLGEHR